MFSFFLHHNRRKSYPSSIHKWLCKPASSHLSLWTTKSTAFGKDFMPEKTCKLLRRLLYRNGFVLCSILASPIFVWRNGVWQRRRLFHRPYPRFPNLYRCNTIKRTEVFQQGNIWKSFLQSLTWFALGQKIFAESNAFCRPSEQMRRSLLKNHLQMGGI